MKRNIVESYSIEEAFRALNRSAKRCSNLTEEFENVGTYKYTYISNTGDEYEEFMTDEEIDNAYATNNFTDAMWLKGEAFITKENGTYQVSWGEFDDYHEASTIEKCKNIVKKFHPNGFKWILDTNESQDVTEALTTSWLDIQNQIALEQEDGINPLYDESAAGDYILELTGKIESDLDLEVIPSVQGGYGDVYIHLGDSHINSDSPVGPIDFVDFSKEVIDLILEADSETDFINHYKANILAYIDVADTKNASEKALNVKLEIDSSKNESLNESVDSDIIELSGDAIGYPAMFADEMSEYMEDIEESDSTVAKYYSEKGVSEEDLMIKKIFITDPATWVSDDGEPCTLTPQEAIEEGWVEDFGFQIANGDYLYSRTCHDIGPAYVKCKSYESMCDYVKNGYMPDSWNVDDLIED